jgi:hypothetical protein
MAGWQQAAARFARPPRRKTSRKRMARLPRGAPVASVNLHISMD